VPGCDHPHAPKPTSSLIEDLIDHSPSNLAGDPDDDVLQYVGQIHGFLARSTRSGLLRRAGGRGALLAFRAFRESSLALTPTPSTPDPRDAFNAPDANE
jgi:hypothetical protein